MTSSRASGSIGGGLFEDEHDETSAVFDVAADAPLAERMRPASIEDFFGGEV